MFLHRYLEDHPDCCVIDSFNNIYPVLDRLEIQEILLCLEDLKTEGCSTIRGPHFLKVLCLDGFLLWYCCIKFFFFLSIQPCYSFKWMINWDLSVFVAMHKDKSQLFNPWVIWMFEVILIMFNDTQLKV